MENQFIDSAKMIYRLALQDIERHQLVTGYELMGLAFASAFMAGSTTPITFRIVPRAALPRPIGSTDHVICQLDRGSIAMVAAAEIFTKPLFTFERFPVVGHLLSMIAERLPESGTLDCIVDLGDGEDSGDYRRIAFCSARADSILMPDPYFHFNRNYDDHRADVALNAKPWQQRENIIFWRGGSGGPRVREPDPGDPFDWRCQQRLQLCSAARTSDHSAMLDIGLVHLRTIDEDYLRHAILSAGFLKAEVPKSYFLQFRYQVDVDGWTNAWSLLDKMISGATILKVASAFGFRQWFYDKLIPWGNFIPVAADLSDFDPIVAWIIAHEEDCRRIAENCAATARTIQLGADLAQTASEALAAFGGLDRTG